MVGGGGIESEGGEVDDIVFVVIGLCAGGMEVLGG